MSTPIKRVDPFNGMIPAYPPAVGTFFTIGEQECLSSSSTSSIGRNSDDGDEKSSDGGDNEVESSYKGGPLDLMVSMEEALPIRRGISKFYNGKSKSFMKLKETASCSSIKDITKPENAYSRRRRNLVSHNLWEKTRSGISKRGIRSSKSTLALAMVMNGDTSSSSSGSISSNSSFGSWSCEDSLKGHCCNYAWRSYSVADLAGGDAKIGGHGV